MCDKEGALPGEAWLYFTWLEQSSAPCLWAQITGSITCWNQAGAGDAAGPDRSSEFAPQTAVSSSDTPAVPWMPPHHNLLPVSNVSPRLQGSGSRASIQTVLYLCDNFFLKSVGKNTSSYCQKRSPAAIGTGSPWLRGFPSGTRDDRFLLIPVSKWIINTPPASCHLIGLSLSPPIVEGTCQL